MLWRLCEREKPIPTLTKGNVVLIGDAAHPMLPRKFCTAFRTTSTTDSLTFRSKLPIPFCLSPPPLPYMTQKATC